MTEKTIEKTAERSNSSRQRILDAAESLILQKGYTGTSIEDILQEACITKGGFFYHFNGKTDMARALVERYLAEDARMFDAFMDRADALCEDPLQRLLLFLKLLAEGVGGQTAVHPGCLAGAFIYELSQFDSEMRALLMQGVLHWRAMIVTRLKQIIPLYPPRTEVDVDVLGDMFTSAIEGGIMLARLFDSNQPISQQVLAFRTHIRLLFEPDLRG